jgi:tRNA G18 (ribose-2'-O)-methylase SpoU
MNLINVMDIDPKELLIYKELRDKAFTADNSFIADSSKVVNLILESSLEVKSVFATQEYYDEFSELINRKQISKLYVATKETMQSMVGHKVHHNVMLHGIRPTDTDIERLDNQIVMLDNITSSENVGSIARSAVALGVNSYLIPKQAPHPFGRRSLRVSMGHTSRMKIHQYENIKITIALLKKLGYSIFAAEITKDSLPLSKVTVPNKWVLILGHEGHGIAKEILDLCDAVVHIEMEPNVKSFNVAVAASIIMYQFKKI